MTDLVLYGGKGGVGKTTMAAATGLGLARAGHETLVVSTDPAHSLGDAFDVNIGREPTAVEDQLWAVETDPQAGVDRYRALFESLAADLTDAGLRVDDEELTALFTAGIMPGSDELAALDGMATYLDDGRWDRLVFDTAPTGHTLRLLDLPDVMDRGLVTALDIKDQVRRKVDTARTMLFGPMARRESDDAEAFTELRDRMERVRTALRDADRTTFRVVTVPEPMAVRETERLVDQLRDLGVPVTTLVVNRVIADAGDCKRCQTQQTDQQEALKRLRTTFPDFDIREVPERPGGTAGLDALAALDPSFRSSTA